jgi:hypothetical protein
MLNTAAPEIDSALARASDELRLPVYYRDCVRPLLSMSMEQWPSCCGGHCEPCMQLLVAVARRVHEHLNRDVGAELQRRT